MKRCSQKKNQKLEPFELSGRSSGRRFKVWLHDATQCVSTLRAVVLFVDLLGREFSEALWIWMPTSPVLREEHGCVGQVVEIGPVLLLLCLKSIVEGLVVRVQLTLVPLLSSMVLIQRDHLVVDDMFQPRDFIKVLLERHQLMHLETAGLLAPSGCSASAACPGSARTRQCRQPPITMMPMTTARIRVKSMFRKPG